jgi:fatty-acyl-CoA synthase
MTIIEEVSARRAAIEAAYPTWPRLTLGSHFNACAKRFGERPALSTPSGSLTYSELFASAREQARRLMAAGVRRRDHVAILMANDQEHVATTLGAWLAGAVVVPINHMLTTGELGYILGQGDVSCFVYEPSAASVEHSIVELRELAARQSQVTLATVVIKGDRPASAGDVMPIEALDDPARQISDAELDGRISASYAADEVADIIYTSGSTGVPKGVILTHDMLLRSGYSTVLSRAFWDGRKIFTALPIYHVFALVEGLIAGSFVGGELILAPRFAPREAFALIERFRAEDVLCVPSMLVALLGDEARASFDLSSLKSIMCAAAPASISIWERAIRELGLKEICTGYGGTEVAAATTHTEPGDPPQLVATRVGRIKPGGVSGIPEFGGANVEYKTVDPFTGKDLPPGATGELCARGNVVTRAYYRKPEETAAAIDLDGWFRSGDLGRIDDNGYLELLGRSKEVYRVSGENVAPKEVEDVINQHPDVVQAYVVGVSDPLTGEIGAAFVELAPGATLTRAEVVEHCRGRLARFKIPRYVFFVSRDEWPMTGTGKIQKFRLVAEAEKRVGRED